MNDRGSPITRAPAANYNFEKKLNFEDVDTKYQNHAREFKMDNDYN
jgi:hypothetical protein